MSIFPLVKNFKSDSFLNAFILNSMTTALIAAFAIELHIQLDHKDGVIYNFFNNIMPGATLYRHQTFMIQFSVTFILALLVYQIMHLVFDFGGGMMINDP